MKPFYTVEQTAQILPSLKWPGRFVSDRYVRELLEKGVVFPGAYKIGTAWVIPCSEVNTEIKRRWLRR